MTRGRLLARAVAYTAAPAERHHQELEQTELEVFWGLVDQLRQGVQASALERGVQVPPRHFDNRSVPVDTSALQASTPRAQKPLSPMEANRLRREFWADQAES